MRDVSARKIDWERDILYIGDRTGHLHNTEFLKTVELAGGLGKVKNLAIYEDVWAETNQRHGNQSQEFKRCSPVGVVQQLGVQNLTIVGKAGFFRNGTEFWNEVDEREWLWNNDTEADDLDEYEQRIQRLREEADDHDSEEDSEDGEVPELEQARRRYVGPTSIITTSAPLATTQVQETPVLNQQVPRSDQSSTINVPDPSETHSEVDEEDAGDESNPYTASESSVSDYSQASSFDSLDIDDRWACDGPVVHGEDPRVYKPRAFDSKLEQHRVPSGDSGLALVDYSSIPGRPFWLNGVKRFHGLASLKSHYLIDFDKAKTLHVQFYSETIIQSRLNTLTGLVGLPLHSSLSFSDGPARVAACMIGRISKNIASPGKKPIQPSEIPIIISSELFREDITRPGMWNT